MFKKISHFLQNTIPIWWEELLYLYPHYNGIPKDWVDELENLSHSELYQVAGEGDWKKIENKRFKETLLEIEEMSSIPSISSQYPVKSISNHLPFSHIRGKKEHELLRLYSFFTSFLSQNPIHCFYDFCSGMGHLSQYLSCSFNLPSYSFDFDPMLQKQGIERYHQYKHSVTYISHNLETSIPSIQQLERVSSDRIDIGLHTCGPLARHHFSHSIKKGTQWILNFGCCYHKLAEKRDYNISNYAQKWGTALSADSLTLASRFKSELTINEFERKFRVKRYRYALFIWIYHHSVQYTFYPVGNSPSVLYYAPFSEYAFEQFRRIGFPHPWPTIKDLEDFYHDPYWKRVIHRMILMGCIRNEWGKLLELYLLLDRRYYLEENGYRAKLYSFFDKKISPRHMGLLAQLY